MLMTVHLDFSPRSPVDGVDALFYQRWSPRAFKATPLSKQQLECVFDAARWSPSCFNDQPWSFVTCTAKTHDLFVSLLAEANQAWAKTAPVVGFVLGRRHFQHNGNDNHFFQFDAGAAWMAMTLQARKMGLYTHGMGGVNFDAVYEALNIDKSQQQVLCAFVIGELDEYGHAAQAGAITPRNALSEVWQQFDGK